MADQVFPINDSQRTAARVAALANLVTFPLIVYANFAMRGGLFVSDLAETVRRIAAAELLFRASIAIDIVYGIGAVVVLTYNPKAASVLIYDRFTTDGLAGALPAALALLLVALGVFLLVRLLQPKQTR